MRIAGSNVALASEHSYTRFEHSRAAVRVWRERAAPEQPQPRQLDGARRGEEELRCSDHRLNLMALLVERLTGRPVNVLDPSDLTPREGPALPARDPRGDVAVQIDVESTRYEQEATAFSAAGTVTTADGRTIDFQVEVAMEREHLDHTELHLTAGAARKKDPLVLSLEGGAAQLTDWKVRFDLDADGASEQISFVGPGAAFLALDRNDNGAVDDGAELFGARTGDGFAELSRLDDDRDGWIDGDDAAFGRLLLWQRTQDGSETLRTLAQAGVGAIYTSSAATPFTIESGDRQELGEVRSTGVYLGETGGAGAVQQIDLVV